MSQNIPTQEQLDEMTALGAATLFHGAGECGAVDTAIASIASGMKLAGPILTVDLPPGDNLALHLAISTAQAGTVLVVDYKQHMEIRSFSHFSQRLPVAMICPVLLSPALSSQNFQMI